MPLCLARTGLPMFPLRLTAPALASATAAAVAEAEMTTPEAKAEARQTVEGARVLIRQGKPAGLFLG